MKSYKFIICLIVCGLFAACKDNSRHHLALIQNLPDYYVYKDNNNLIIYSQNDTLVNLVQKNGEYMSKKDGLVVLSTKNYDGYYSNKVDGFTKIEGCRHNGFKSSFKLRNNTIEYLVVRYDSCYGIKCISKMDRISYGKYFPDDMEKDICLVDTSFLNKQLEGWIH